MDFGVFYAKIRPMVDWFKTHPGVFILISIFILVFAIFSMDDTHSSTGAWFWIVIAIIMFLFGLGATTGIGFGMSF
jgi:predicted membrane-bound dolichyl-phosphate-mannose-protein mannosyltransferase